MASIIKIAVLLAVVAGTSPSEYLCRLPAEDHMRCDSQGLNTPPPGLWPQITKLDLSGNKIIWLQHERAFSGFPALEELDLSNNSFIEIKFGVLATIANLSVLSIAKNKQNSFIMRQSPNGISSEKLRTIDFSQNGIWELDPNLFLFAPNLHFLNISANILVVSPGEVLLNHPNLQVLIIGYEDLYFEVVDSALLSGLPNLRQLWIIRTNISSVDGGFVNNKLLEKIDLSSNAISQIIPGTFAGEGRIRDLILRGNSLTRLDTAALSDAMAAGGHIDIRDSPLACGCGFESLFRWSLTRNITIDSSCNGQCNCSFTIRR